MIVGIKYTLNVRRILRSGEVVFQHQVEYSQQEILRNDDTILRRYTCWEDIPLTDETLDPPAPLWVQQMRSTK